MSKLVGFYTPLYCTKSTRKAERSGIANEQPRKGDVSAGEL